MAGDSRWIVYEEETRVATTACRRVEIFMSITGQYELRYYEAFGREPQITTAPTLELAKSRAQIIFANQRRFSREVKEEWKKKLAKTPNEAPIGHPEPPHETDLGKDSTPAPEMAQVAEDQLVAEEIATDE